MRLAIVVGLVGVIAASAACGKSAEQKAAEQAAENARVAAEQMKKAAESAAAAGTAAGAAGAAAGVDAFARAMAGAANAMAAKGPDGKAVEPVSFRELQTVLPEVSGWEREEPKGEKMTLPVPFSQTETRYKKGDASVEMKIVDSGFSQLLFAPYAVLLSTGYEKESSSGYEKATSFAGNPGFEKWDKDTKDGQIVVVVGNRFLVTIDGDDIGDNKVLQEFVSKVDLSKLAALK
jgi:hypothetical protein